MATSEYTKEEESYLSQFSTARRLFWGKMFIDNRRAENSHLALPKGVEEGRRWNDDLQAIKGRLEEINKNTHESVGFLSALFSGLGQAVAERKAKKK